MPILIPKLTQEFSINVLIETKYSKFIFHNNKLLYNKLGFFWLFFYWYQNRSSIRFDFLIIL